jgi:hypothetical protein
MSDVISNWLMGSMIAVFTVMYSYTVTYLLRRRRERLKEQKRNFHKTLLAGFKSGAITSMEDVVNVYKGVSGTSPDDLSYRYGISRQLREFLVDLLSKDLVPEIEDSVVVEWKEKISSFIKTNEEISPYADLPSAERIVLNDITSFLERQDIDSTRRKLAELGGMIQARHDNILKIQNVNRYSVPLSVIGMILTIAFGLIAIFK